MDKRLAFVCDGMYMFVDSSIRSVDESTKCIIYNARLDKWSPETCVGSWTCRMGPWDVPTQDQIKKAGLLLKAVQNENNSQR